jgi:hypothetical protein
MCMICFRAKFLILTELTPMIHQLSL